MFISDLISTMSLGSNQINQETVFFFIFDYPTTTGEQKNWKWNSYRIDETC